MSDGDWIAKLDSKFYDQIIFLFMCQIVDNFSILTSTNTDVYFSLMQVLHDVDYSIHVSLRKMLQIQSKMLRAFSRVDMQSLVNV